MRMSNVATVFVILHISSALSAMEAQTPTSDVVTHRSAPALTEESRADEPNPRPDYSKEALLSITWIDPRLDDEVPRAPDTFSPFEFELFGQTFRFMPFLGSGGMHSSATPFQFVDPFQIAPVSAAHTPSTFRDRWAEWKLKRFLKHAARKKK